MMRDTYPTERWSAATVCAPAERSAPQGLTPTFLDDFDGTPSLAADQHWLFVDNEPEALRRPSLRRSNAQAHTPSIKGAEANRTAEAAQAAARRACPMEQARVFLQRKGYVVYRASVDGGRANRWSISGWGRDNSDADLIAVATAQGFRA